MTSHRGFSASAFRRAGRSESAPTEMRSIPMEELKAAAWMVRYGARSLIHNLDYLPADRANWKPEPGAKSPLEIATEVLRAFCIYLPIFHGAEYPDPRPPLPRREPRKAPRRPSPRPAKK